MSFIDTLADIAGILVLIDVILFPVSWIVTIRKLRKIPATKDFLGIEFVVGWTVVNVGGAFGLPRWFNRKLRTTPLARCYADADGLEPYTSRLDRIMSRLFFWAMTLATVLALVGAHLEYIGFDR